MGEKKIRNILNPLAQNVQKVSVAAGEKAKKAVSVSKDALTKIADRDHDGKLTRADLSLLAENAENTAIKATSKIAESAKSASTQLSQKLDDKRRLADIKALRPIFADDVQQESFMLSKMIRLTEIDKRRAESEVCQGSIGYTSVQKDFVVVNIFKNCLAQFPITLYPDEYSELYYVNPVDPTQYIALNSYFEYLQKARVAELQRIAQDLGATHFRVTFKEQKKRFTSSSLDVDVSVKGKVPFHLNSSDRYSSKDFSNIQVAAEMDFEGHEPTYPALAYYKDDSAIQTLVEMRMHQNAMKHQLYLLSLDKASGISRDDAVKIDTTIKALKIAGNASFSHGVEDEGRKVIEYEIDF